MISPVVVIMIVGSGLWLTYVLIKDRQFVKSLVVTPETRFRLVTWSELALAPLRKATVASRELVQDAYTNTPISFSMWSLLIVAAAATIAGFSMFTEFNLLTYTFGLFLNEVSGQVLAISEIPLSAVLAIALIGIVAIAGMVHYDRLGHCVEEEPDLHAKIISNHRYKQVAFHGILLIAIVQGIVAWGRGEEFLTAANFQTLIYGDAAAAAGQDTNGWAVSAVSALIGFAVPWISAYCTRYLLTLLAWTAASLAAILLFLFLWLPTWLINGFVVRYQNEHGLPPVSVEQERTEASQSERPPGLSEEPVPQNPAFNERIEEERDELYERRESEQRERWRVNFNPFDR